MKEIIKTVMKACNPNGTQVEAGMMKFQNGHLIAYGGTFCIQAPVDIAAECAFNPATLLAFHRKDREGASYTVKENKLILRHKRERVTMQCLPASDLAIIDVFTDKRKSKALTQKAAKTLEKCIDSGIHNHSMQGVLIRDGYAIASDGKILVMIKLKNMGYVHCVIPTDTIKFIAAYKHEITHYAYDESNIKFYFADGLSLTSRLISPENYPDVSQVIEQDHEEFTLTDVVMDDLKSLDSDFVEVSNLRIKYKVGDKDIGEIKIADDDIELYNFYVNKKNFDVMLSINRSNKFYFNPQRSVIFGDGGKFFNSAIVLSRGEAK